jgi:multisubunit Na+/H+ antiporter MnhF subunit
VTGWLLAAAVLMVGGFGPAVLISARGSTAGRLVGLQLTGVVGVVVLLLLAHGYQQSSYLIVPTVLALLSVAGVLVFTGLLGSL